MCYRTDSLKNLHLIIVLAMVIALSHQALFLDWTCDDAFISYRYAENLSHGQGLVFNTGERVEGFSNFFWVVLLAFFNIFGISALWVSKILSLCFSLLLIGFIFKTAYASGVGAAGSILCSFLVSSATSLAYFSMSGLETVLYTLLLLLAVYLNIKYKVTPKQKTFFLLYAVLLLAAITRPEGILFLLVSTVYHLGQGLRQKKCKAFKAILPAPLLVLSVYAGFILFRYVYYSDILPNTFYAKPLGTFVDAGYNAFFVNFSSGLTSGSFFLIPLLLFIVNRRFLAQNLYPVLFCLIQALFMSYAGDWMAFGRFFFPIFPLAVVLTLTFLSTFPTSSSPIRWKSRTSILCLVAWIFFAGLNGAQTIKALENRDNYPYLVMNSAELTKVGKWLKDNFTSDTTIALRRQGAIPYYSGMMSIDFLGLTNRKIAQTLFKENDMMQESRLIAAYIVKQKPDLIILFSSKSEVSGWLLNESPSEGRLIYLEHLIHNLAVDEGYAHRKDISLGETETAHLLMGMALVIRPYTSFLLSLPFLTYYAAMQ